MVHAPERKNSGRRDKLGFWRWAGGTGRRDGLRSHWAQARGGSNPSPSTTAVWPTFSCEHLGPFPRRASRPLSHHPDCHRVVKRNMTEVRLLLGKMARRWHNGQGYKTPLGDLSSEASYDKMPQRVQPVTGERIHHPRGYTNGRRRVSLRCIPETFPCGTAGSGYQGL